jgi:o-succinylbenzoate synthase
VHAAAFDALDPVAVERIELVTLELPFTRPFRTAGGSVTSRRVMLVHVVAESAEGWAECVAEAAPNYSPEFTASAALVLRDHLAPLVDRRADVLALHDRLRPVRGHQMAKAALELAVLDAQLRTAGRSLAGWLGATRATVAAGAAIGLHDAETPLLAEVDEAVAAGAARLRVKVVPGRAAGVLASVRGHVGDATVLQADANGSFDPAAGDHVTELVSLDRFDLACLEQPHPPDDLVAHAALAVRMDTPICLDESVGSAGDLEAAVALGACEVLCLKPGRVGGWLEARRIHDRCLELGIPVWVGGMLETAVGRAANTAVAALPGMVMAPDLDPRPRFAADLTSPLAAEGGAVIVPDAPGTGAVPDWAQLLGSEMEVILR